MLKLNPRNCYNSGSDAFVLVLDVVICLIFQNGFDGTYYPVTTLTTCEGYWIKMPYAMVYEVCGQEILSCNEYLQAGWHLEGGPNCVCTPITNPPGCIEVIYGFDGSYYPTTQMEPTKGYWVKMGCAADLIRDCGSGIADKREHQPFSVAGVDNCIKLTASAERADGDNVCVVSLAHDPQLGSLPAPPAPPDYEVWMELFSQDWEGPLHQATLTDGNVWYLSVDVSGTPQSSASALLTWDLSDFSNEVYRLVSGYSNDGEVLVEDMAVADNLRLDGVGVHYLTLARVTSGELTVASETLPTDFALHQSYPNPFNPQVTIQFDLPVSCDVDLAIYDVLGRRVRTLVAGLQPAGSRTITWDGKDQNGSRVSSGIYFYRLTAGGFVETKKMVLMK